MPIVSTLRLALLRAMYLLFAAGLGLTLWPAILRHSQPWELREGVVNCMLAAFSALAVLGLRYPLQMLPLMLWEMVWKALWLALVALPLWRDGRMDDATAATAFACLFALPIPFIVPWRYVFAHYVRKPGDPWRGQRARVAPSAPGVEA